MGFFQVAAATASAAVASVSAAAASGSREERTVSWSSAVPDACQTSAKNQTESCTTYDSEVKASKWHYRILKGAQEESV